MVVLEQLRGRAISMQGLQRTRKLHMIREYLLSEEGRRWHTVRREERQGMGPTACSAARVVPSMATPPMTTRATARWCTPTLST